MIFVGNMRQLCYLRDDMKEQLLVLDSEIRKRQMMLDTSDASGGRVMSRLIDRGCSELLVRARRVYLIPWTKHCVVASCI